MWRARAGHANHAEFIAVPEFGRQGWALPFREAAFATLGAIALQGCAAPNRRGETVVVIGSGLIGLLTAQLLARTGQGSQLIWPMSA